MKNPLASKSFATFALSTLHKGQKRSCMQHFYTQVYSLRRRRCPIAVIKKTQCDSLRTALIKAARMNPYDSHTQDFFFFFLSGTAFIKTIPSSCYVEHCIESTWIHYYQMADLLPLLIGRLPKAISQSLCLDFAKLG